VTWLPAAHGVQEVLPAAEVEPVAQLVQLD
jgi:hypothetical protein